MENIATPFTQTAAQIVALILFALILWRTEPALNRMGKASPPLMVRVSFILLATGAIAGILGILSGQVPDTPSLILTAGTAALTFCERRIRLLTGHHHPQRKGIRHAKG